MEPMMLLILLAREHSAVPERSEQFVRSRLSNLCVAVGTAYIALLSFRAHTDLLTRSAHLHNTTNHTIMHQSANSAIAALSILYYHRVHAESQLWNAMAVLDARLSALEPEQATLLLREMASQLENKLARLFMPSLQDARHTTLARLRKHLQVTSDDDSALTTLLSNFPGVEEGLDVLKGLCALTTYSQTVSVSYDALAAAVEAQFTDADPTKPDVKSVLECLQHLAKSMSESPFVVTA
jgi:hypothetical protein